MKNTWMLQSMWSAQKMVFISTQLKNDIIFPIALGTYCCWRTIYIHFHSIYLFNWSLCYLSLFMIIAAHISLNLFVTHSFIADQCGDHKPSTICLCMLTLYCVPSILKIVLRKPVSLNRIGNDSSHSQHSVMRLVFVLIHHKTFELFSHINELQCVWITIIDRIFIMHEIRCFQYVLCEYNIRVSMMITNNFFFFYFLVFRSIIFIAQRYNYLQLFV